MSTACWRLVVILQAALVLATASGCAAYDRASLVATGPGTDFSASEVADYRAAQDRVLLELIAAAQAPGLPASAATAVPSAAPAAVPPPAVAASQPMAGAPVPGTPVSWDQVVRAGIDYADVRCERYLHALFRLHRDRKTAVAQTSLLGSATAGVQAALGEAAKQVAITALLFGLAGSTIDNLASNLLYELEPSSVHTLVKAQQAAYFASLGSGYPDRASAMKAIRGYAVLCVPVSIEAEVNLAVKKAVPLVTEAKPQAGQPPVVSNSEVVVSTTSFGADDSSTRLDAFVNPKGKLDANNERRLLDYMEANGIPRTTGTTSFIYGKSYAAARKAAVRHFGL